MKIFAGWPFSPAMRYEIFCSMTLLTCSEAHGEMWFLLDDPPHLQWDINFCLMALLTHRGGYMLEKWKKFELWNFLLDDPSRYEIWKFLLGYPPHQHWAIWGRKEKFRAMKFLLDDLLSPTNSKICIFAWWLLSIMKEVI